MRNLARCTRALLVLSLSLAHAAHAEEWEDQADASEFVRKGFYLGVGGTAAFPIGWNNDFDNSLNGEASGLANLNAQAALDVLPPANDEIIPLAVTVAGADLEAARFGVNGVIGYRAGARVAIEVEGEWLAGSNQTDLRVTSLSEFQLNLIRQSSTGFHTAEVGDIWTITANVKVYPPLSGRFQPFLKVGLGAQHSTLTTDIETSGLTTTSSNGTIVVPADFQIRSIETNVDGALRAAAGIDIYATRNLVAEYNVGYVVPFASTGSVTTDYVVTQLRLIYRF